VDYPEAGWDKETFVIVIMRESSLPRLHYIHRHDSNKSLFTLVIIHLKFYINLKFSFVKRFIIIRLKLYINLKFSFVKRFR